jgi:hypothetical protein
MKAHDGDARAALGQQDPSITTLPGLPFCSWPAMEATFRPVI